MVLEPQLIDPCSSNTLRVSNLLQGSEVSISHQSQNHELDRGKEPCPTLSQESQEHRDHEGGGSDHKTWMWRTVSQK